MAGNADQDHSKSPSSDGPKIRIVSPPQSVPVYLCVIRFAKNSKGQLEGGVANCPQIQLSGDSERSILQQGVTLFKSYIQAELAAGRQPALLDPLPDCPAEMHERFIPVHL
ncbi:MAG: hypothetical protein R3C28_13385 [Pirellulaceae bacterium]